MRRLALSTLLLALAMGPAHGASDFTVSGTIALPSPEANLSGGVTEIAGACDPSSPVQSVDGDWILLPDGADGQAITIVPDAASDMDGYFYDASCSLIRYFDLAAKTSGRTETGIVPDAAKYVIVDQADGLNGTYTLTIPQVLP
jgi:hypothetical protein